jgi:hypothetical protein
MTIAPLSEPSNTKLIIAMRVGSNAEFVADEPQTRDDFGRLCHVEADRMRIVRT